MIDINTILVGSVVAVAIAILAAPGQPFWWPGLQRRWGHARLDLLKAQRSRLEAMLSNPAQRLANTTRHAANRTMGMLIVMFAMTMVVLLGILAGVEGNVNNGVIIVPDRVAWMLAIFAAMTPLGLILTLNAHAHLREHVGAEQLAEKVKKQIEE